MNIKLFLLGILLTIVPLLELRGGLPLVIYSINDLGIIQLFFAFLLIVLINLGLIFFLFFFLEKIHHSLTKWKIYHKTFEKYLQGIQKKAHKISKKEGNWVFLSLFLLVAIPLPLTGAYTGTPIAWFLDLNKKKSIIAISLGVLMAGIIITLAAKGLLNFLL